MVSATDRANTVYSASLPAYIALLFEVILRTGTTTAIRCWTGFVVHASVATRWLLRHLTAADLLPLPLQKRDVRFLRWIQPYGSPTHLTTGDVTDMQRAADMEYALLPVLLPAPGLRWCSDPMALRPSCYTLYNLFLRYTCGSNFCIVPFTLLATCYYLPFVLATVCNNITTLRTIWTCNAGSGSHSIRSAFGTDERAVPWDIYLGRYYAVRELPYFTSAERFAVPYATFVSFMTAGAAIYSQMPLVFGIVPLSV